jgi:hypothetical protein
VLLLDQQKSLHRFSKSGFLSSIALRRYLRSLGGENVIAVLADCGTPMMKIKTASSEIQWSGSIQFLSEYAAKVPFCNCFIPLTRNSIQFRSISP